MSSKFLRSNIAPMPFDEESQTIDDCFHQEFERADSVEIAVGYVSQHAVEHLIDLVVSADALQSFNLYLGMYALEGFPAFTLKAVQRLDNALKDKGVGSVYLVKSFPYHGKNYLFMKEGNLISAIVGSGNLGCLCLDGTNNRQFETAIYETDEVVLKQIELHIKQLSNLSEDISTCDCLIINNEKNHQMTSHRLVTDVGAGYFDYLVNQEPVVEFDLPIKVPTEATKLINDRQNYTRSNINVCYAAPRSSKKSRDWFETQFHVSVEIRRMQGYPQKKVPFFVVTDDGYMFKAHTTSAENKQLSAVGDELIIGKWLKGRLLSAGLVEMIPDTMLDTERKGMITKEMLQAYGADTLKFKKTPQQHFDPETNSLLDVWVMIFGEGDK